MAPWLRGCPLSSAQAERPYLPAAGRDWLLVFYDPIAKLLRTESAHRELIEQARLGPGQRVLEIGCGTGNLTLLVKTLHPGVEVVGLDPDPKALARARRKAEGRRLAVTLDRGYSDELPYPDGSYDRVLSAFMLHHLSRDEKSRTLHQVRRVLRPGGSLPCSTSAEVTASSPACSASASISATTPATRSSRSCGTPASSTRPRSRNVARSSVA